MIGPLLKLAGKREVAEAIVFFSAVATKVVDEVFDRLFGADDEDEKKPEEKKA